ncbi:hypothetical protein ARAM_004727 [Aspergillus rambellii]|uniref:Uncharacterized protein n=1 Tax=Aspergillus rambellii TaxID=308745 RepID=A0A0F8TZ85_9EURO|nr:hypothetical protein ARAM_004727 [Aspergillus rambellii]
MSGKRKSSGAVSASYPYPKRARPSYAHDDQEDDDPQRSVTPYERPRNHPVFGQKSAFPGLDTGEGDELFYGPAEDGLEYLRMVRSEANTLPTLFTAPTIETGEGIEETKEVPVEVQAEEEKQTIPAQRIREGVYSDGVYLSLTKTEPAPVHAYSDAQACYYNLLHHRFLLLRSILKCAPPSEAIVALDDSHPISLPRRSKTAQREWRRLLLQVDPQTVQLACMDMDSVLGVLGIMARLMSENVRSGNTVLVRRIGAWAWGLLGKCRDVGQLGTEEVGDIRELGKRAVKILSKMREEEKEGQAEEEEEDAEEEEDGYESDVEKNIDGQMQKDEKQEEAIIVGDTDPTAAVDPDQPDAEKAPPGDEELERAKVQLRAQIWGTENGSAAQEAEEGDQSPVDDEDSGLDVSTQIRAMLDMIITVVGEHYGQRDLLEARETWTCEAAGFSEI